MESAGVNIASVAGRWLALCFALLLLAQACSNGEQGKLVMATHVWPGYELISLPIQRGELDMSDISLLDHNSAGESMQSILDGRADVATLTLDEALSLRQAGVPIKVIHIIDVSHGADAVISREPLQPGPDLKGKRIAVESKLVGGLMLESLMKASGLAPSDLNVVSLEDVTVDTWQSDIDLLITYEPVLSRLIRQGAHKIYDSSEIPFTIIDVLVATEDALRENPSAVKELAKGFVLGREIWLSNPMDSEYRMAAALEMAPEEVHSTFNGILLPDLEYTRHMLQHPESSLLTTCQNISQRQHMPRQVCQTLFSSDLLPAKRP